MKTYTFEVTASASGIEFLATRAVKADSLAEAKAAVKALPNVVNVGALK